MDSFFIIVIAIGVALVIFLAMREIMLWYFKINRLEKQLALMNENIKLLVEAAGKTAIDIKAIKIE